MKNLLSFAVLLSVAVAARAFSNSSPSSTTQSVTLAGPAPALNLSIVWTCDDAPQRGARGQFDLLDGGGNLVASAWGLVSRTGGVGYNTTGGSSVSNVNWWMNVWSADGTPADGGMDLTWNLPGLAPGTYTLRLWNYTTYDTILHATTVWTWSMFDGLAAPPPPVQYTLSTAASAGGAVSAGGSFDAGTVVSVSAVPDAQHDFAGWSGDASGFANPIALTMDADKSVTANFSPKFFAVTTSATAGGSVTPGGSYPYGASITLTATPDATHTFLGWSGDASGSAPSLVINVTAPMNVQAMFSGKTAQTITFPSPGSQPAGGPAFGLTGTASSGLPVSYLVLSGPAVINGNQVQLTGPGPVTVQASQAGDANYLPAPSVSQTFNAVTTAAIKYQSAGRTVLQDSTALGTANLVLEKS